MSERYNFPGRALTPLENELLTCLIEECAEVIQAACKLQRFGVETGPNKEHTNSEELSLEVGDLEIVLETLYETTLLDPELVYEGRKRKQERLRKYTRYVK